MVKQKIFIWIAVLYSVEVTLPRLMKILPLGMPLPPKKRENYHILELFPVTFFNNDIGIMTGLRF